MRTNVLFIIIKNCSHLSCYINPGRRKSYFTRIEGETRSKRRSIDHYWVASGITRERFPQELLGRYEDSHERGSRVRKKIVISRGSREMSFKDRHLTDLAGVSFLDISLARRKDTGNPFVDPPPD